MKVISPGSVQTAKATSSSQKSKKTGSTAFSDALNASDDVQQHEQTLAMQSVANVDALLLMQQAEEGAGSKDLSHGHSLLDYLEDIRVAFLTGSIKASVIQDLQQRLLSWQQQSDDPKLLKIIDEIQLRAQVELAKLQAT